MLRIKIRSHCLDCICCGRNFFFLILYSFSSSCCVLLETLYTFCYDLFKYFFLWVKTLLTDGQETKRVSFSHGSFRPNDNNGITFYLVSFSSLLFFFFLRRVICFVSFFFMLLQVFFLVPLCSVTCL